MALQTLWYEAHVTISNYAVGQSQEEPLPAAQCHKMVADYAKEIGGKAVLIALANPLGSPRAIRYPYHLMFSAIKAFHYESPAEEKFPDEQAKDWVRTFPDLLKLKAWDIERVKLESQITWGPAVYYEAHWNLEAGDEERVKLVLKNYPQFYYSWNCMKLNKAYLTARFHETDPNMAAEYFSLLTKILQRSISTHKMHTERVIMDDNKQLDLGWAYKGD